MYLGIETVSCRLLQRMAGKDMDWNLEKLGQPFQSFNTMPANIIQKCIMVKLVLPNEICLISSSSLYRRILCVGY